MTLDVRVKDERERRVVSLQGFSGLVGHNVKLLLHSFNASGVTVSFDDLLIGERAASVGDAEACEEESIDWLGQEFVLCLFTIFVHRVAY